MPGRIYWVVIGVPLVLIFTSGGGSPFLASGTPLCLGIMEHTGSIARSLDE